MQSSFSISAILRLVRWQNLIFVSILVWTMQQWVAVPVLAKAGLGNPLSQGMMALLMISIVSIAAAGYVINDYFDVKIDRINRPDRLIITQSVSKELAMRLFQVLTAIGVLSGLTLSWMGKNWSLATIFLVTPGLLWFYSASYKRMFLIGNIIIGLCAAFVPMTVALSNIAFLNVQYRSFMEYMPISHNLICWLGGFALFAFLSTVIREIIKDIQDQEGDQELECRTVPICLGLRWTRVIVTFLIVVLMALLVWMGWFVLPFAHQWGSPSVRYIVFGLLVPLACEVALLWSAKIPSDFRTAQGLMKFVMFIGTLYSFIIVRLL